MSRTPLPLPDALPTIVRLSDLREAGIPISRVRVRSARRLAYGFYRLPAAPPFRMPTEDTPPGAPPPPWPADLVRALQRDRPSAVVSHLSAALVHGLPVPSRALDGPAGGLLHLTVPPETERVRRPGVRDHRHRLPTGHVVEVRGLRVTSLERTWVDLCTVPGMRLEDLVVAGDRVVRRPWTPHGRLPADATVVSLRRALDERGRFRGVVLARQALELVRVGADSPPETLLRLALLDAGCGEPALQHRLDPRDPSSPEADLAYPELLLALQYDGAHHRTREQQARDARRERRAASAGWRTLCVTADDLADDFQEVIADVRRRRRDVPRPAPPAERAMDGGINA